MAQNFRHSEILTIARETGKVTVEDLAARFNVTSQTIRRDLAELCDVGQLSRVHGGAVIPSGVIARGYEDRRSLASDAKDAIARMVAEQIPDGVSIFMNIGTTTEAVARALLKHRNLMVATNNLNVANILATSPNSEVIVTGGILRRADGALPMFHQGRLRAGNSRGPARKGTIAKRRLRLPTMRPSDSFVSRTS